MRSFYPTLFCLLLWVFLDSCSSGKKAYEKGNYYDAVMTAVQRLRQNPDHKKSREVLSMSYRPAVEFLETDAQNQIASNANFKYGQAVADYDQINNLYEAIRTSPGAMKVIVNPVNKYKELTDLKSKAADESYEAGIQSMLKATRQDAKNAYYFFRDANNYSPGHRESVDMMEKARFNATVKVVVETLVDNSYGWNFEATVFGYNHAFVKFYTPRQAQESSLPKVDHYLKVIVNRFTQGLPSITKRVENRKDSVKTGEKTVNGQKVPVYEKVAADITIFEKKINGHGSIELIITDAENRAELKHDEIAADVSWTDSWAIFTGDRRALTEGNKTLIEKREPQVGRDHLQNQAKKDLDDKLSAALKSYYGRY